MLCTVQPNRDTWYEIHLDVLHSNYRAVRQIAGSTVYLCPVLKADAYGMGSIMAARTFLQADRDGPARSGSLRYCAVACLSEAVELREALPDLPLLIMGYTPDRLLPEVVAHRIVPTIFERRQAEILAASAQDTTSVPLHIKIDTGMNRLGLEDTPEGLETVTAISRLPGIRIEGLFSHLALAGRTSDMEQFHRLQQFVRRATVAGVSLGYIHICDSIGMLRYPEFRLDMVRPGAILYGAPPLHDKIGADIGIPFAFKTRIARLRRLGAGEGVSYDYTWRAPSNGAVIATLPVGYADGYQRSFSNTAFTCVRGVRAPVVGLICMDQTMIDVSSVPGVEQGDEVLLLGRSGNSEVPLLEAADWAGSNRNAVLTAIGKRVPRVYIPLHTYKEP
ncbi:MAG: alanine racemase [Spirochaetaceae bacterium]|nr:MAG: alanine racemase [Spirochaetaceae bacterium]